MEQDILSAAEPKLEYVLLLQFIVALGLDALVVEEGAIPRAQVNDVGPHPAAHGAVSSGVLHQPRKQKHWLNHQRDRKHAPKAGETEIVLHKQVGLCSEHSSVPRSEWPKESNKKLCETEQVLREAASFPKPPMM